MFIYFLRSWVGGGVERNKELFEESFFEKYCLEVYLELKFRDNYILLYSGIFFYSKILLNMCIEYIFVNWGLIKFEIIICDKD